MSQSGEIDLNRVKASYTVADIQFVDKRDLDTANDDRLYFELSSSIGLTFLGAELTNHNSYLLFTCIAFGIFAIFFLVKYIIKSNKMNTPPTKEDKKKSIELMLNNYQKQLYDIMSNRNLIVHRKK